MEALHEAAEATAVRLDPPDRRTRARGSGARSYRSHEKLAEGSRCPECGAVYREGRWHWAAGKQDAPHEMCPACRRIADNFPAGIVTLHGPFRPSQKKDLIGLVRHQEAAENGEHPLNRIIGIDDDPERVVITTTDIHLPRRIAEAVRRAFHGAPQIDFDKDEYFVRVNWTLQP